MSGTTEQENIYREIRKLQNELAQIKNFFAGVPISSARIKNITWDKAQGGTAVLGGPGNGNGILEVHDEAGVTKGIWDKDGIHIIDGNIVVENEDGDITFDARGLVSSTNFTLTNSASDSLNQNITSPSGTLITGSTLTFTLDRAASIMVLANVAGFMNEGAGNGNGYAYIELNGAELSFTRILFTSGQNALISGGAHYMIVNLPAGSHTLRLMAVMDTLSGSPVFTVYGYNFSYTKLGT